MLKSIGNKIAHEWKKCKAKQKQVKHISKIDKKEQKV